MAELPQFTRVQELVYELRIERVMTRKLVTVTPETVMSELKELLRVNRISGAPVVDSGKLVGIVSIEDLIKALEQGDIHCPVRKRMTSPVMTVLGSESVIEAVKHFSQHRVGRLPVVNDAGDLVGIITGGDITRGVLQAIGLDYHTEEISKYRASHIFEDIVSDRTGLILRYRVAAGDFTRGGEASSKLKRALERLGAPPQVVRRVAIATYEAEINLVIHTTNGGEIVAEIQPEFIRVVTVDHGPGMADVSQAMEPGYSTAPNWIRELGFGAGMGLVNIKKCADRMNLESEFGVGTRLEIEFGVTQRLGTNGSRKNG